MRDARLLRSKLRLRRLDAHLKTLLFEVVTVSQLRHAHAGEFQAERGDQPVLRQLLVRVQLELRLLVFGVHPGRDDLLVHAVALEPDFDVVEIGLGGAQLVFSVHGRLLKLGVAQLD